MTIQLIPDSAPFNAEQRAWLNGFLSGVLGVAETASDGEPVRSARGDAMVQMAAATATASLTGVSSSPVNSSQTEVATSWKDVEHDDVTQYPWHNPELSIVERMELASGKPLELRMMAAMAQLNCGQCGYLCRTYSKAIETGEEKDLKKCTPGGKDTARALAKLKEEMPSTASHAAEPINAPEQVAPSRINGFHAPSDKGPGNGFESIHYSRENPFFASALDVVRLTQPESAKDVRLISLSLAGSGLKYKVGDALGVIPKNSKEQVEAILRLLKLDGSIPVRTVDGVSTTLRSALAEHCDIVNVSDEWLSELVNRLSKSDDKKRVQQLMDTGSLDDLPDNPRLLDIVARFQGASWTADEMVSLLDRLKPRLYSIASSPLVDPNRVDLVVGVVRYQVQGAWRFGVASNFLASRMLSHEPVPIFVQPSHHFGLPADPTVPVIMVGPGTGIAPFRAFLHERKCMHATGENWLFFGDQHQKTDFLLEQELMEMKQSALLTRLSLAFSRDQSERIYVQHRMMEHREELWRWLQRGAHFYVCGDAARMAGDVERCLIEIAAKCGGYNAEGAKSYVDDLRKSNRYQRDVY
jgi:sulfite reductase (NADPH) flavoprotein alpha-component